MLSPTAAAAAELVVVVVVEVLLELDLILTSFFSYGSALVAMLHGDYFLILWICDGTSCGGKCSTPY